MRAEAGYGGPIVFYTSQVTPARRAEAARVSALGITSDPGELYAILQRVSLSRSPR